MKKRNFLTTIILIIAIGVFAYSAYQLYLIYGDYKGIEEEYDAIRDTVIIQNTVPESDEETEEPAEPKFKVDFEALLAINEDVVGWIRFDEPDIISYPIAHGRDNDKYLHTSLEGKYLSAGTIFVDYENSGDFSDDNTVVYGHNMKNGSMFGRLRKFRDESFCKENPYFYIYTVDGREIKYQIFAVKVVGATSDSYDKFFGNDEQFQKYLDKIYKSALFVSDEVQVTTDDRIVMLSTCTGDDETRLAVYGVVVSETITGE